MRFPSNSATAGDCPNRCPAAHTNTATGIRRPRGQRLGLNGKPRLHARGLRLNLCRTMGRHARAMKIATYNVNSIRRRLPLVLDWMTEHKPDVMCLQETKVQDVDFPLDAFRAAGYHATFRGMKGYNGVATLTRREPERILHGLHEGPDNEDVRIVQTVAAGIPIVNTYVPQGYSVTSDT